MSDPFHANQDVTPTSLYVPVDWVEITPSAEPLARNLRALRASADCTMDVKMAGSEGATRTLAFLGGETRYGIFTHVIAVSAGDAEGGI